MGLAPNLKTEEQRMAATTLAFSAERFDMEVRNDFFAGFWGK
jgi:hypothetical protein